MKKDGKAESTIHTAITRLTRLTKLCCNLDDPERVKTALALAEWMNSTKHNVTTIYDGYAKYKGIQWTPPKYNEQTPVPFIPTEAEIDSLISAGIPKTSTLLQLLKETGARIGEAEQIKWTHVDTQRKMIYIPAEKGSNSRNLPISNKLIAMINSLPKTADTIFKTQKHSLRTTFEHMRNKTAEKLNNPRLKQIHFHTFRHWKGTMEYHKTKDIVHVKTVLGHKTIDATMIYINLEQALWLNQDNDYTCNVAHNSTEAKPLIEIGFEYITTTPDGLMLFRKRK